VVRELPAPRFGCLTRCDARLIGEVIRDLGGGRLTRESVINPSVGLDRLTKPGDKVDAGAPLCRIHAVTDSAAESAAIRLAPAFEIDDHPPAALPLIHESL
jgi:thymidine phosphorylase